MKTNQPAKHSNVSRAWPLKYDGPIKHTCCHPDTQTADFMRRTYAHTLVCTHTQKIPDKTHKITDKSPFQPSHA